MYIALTFVGAIFNDSLNDSGSIVGHFMHYLCSDRSNLLLLF